MTMIDIWLNAIQTCGHACGFALVSPNVVFPRLTFSFGRLSNEWTSTVYDVMNVHCGVTIATIPAQMCERWCQFCPYSKTHHSTGDPLHSRALAHSRAPLFTQPCSHCSHSRAPGEQWARLCVFTLHGCVQAARLCRGSPVHSRREQKSPNYSQSPSKIHWSQIELCQDCKIYVIILSHDFCDVIRELTITANNAATQLASIDWSRVFQLHSCGLFWAGHGIRGSHLERWSRTCAVAKVWSFNDDKKLSLKRIYSWPCDHLTTGYWQLVDKR